MQKIIVLFFGLVLLNFTCSNNSNELRLQNENIVLHNQLDSLQQEYNILDQKYVELKNIPPDTIEVLVPSDSINWIDSIRYVLKDSLVFITHDSTIINYKDSIVLVPRDTLIIHIKDSLIYNCRDTLLYNYQDSTIISYDKRTFPEKNIEKYLNLFFKTDNVDDTAGLKFNFSIFDGRRRSYLLDTNYSVPDSLTGWDLEWYHDVPNNMNEIRVVDVWWKENGLAEPVPISKLNDDNLNTSYDFNRGYIIADLGDVFSVDSICLYLPNKEEIGWWLSFDNVEQGSEKYTHEGNSYGNGFINSYVPKNKNIRFINISTKSGIEWKLKELKVYGK